MSRTRLAALALALLACSAPRLAAAHGGAHYGNAYWLDVIDESGRPLPTFHHRGRTYILGTHGQRYMLRIRNRTGARIEVVASVDGRDVIDGKPSSVSKPGYLVQPWGQVVIDGFRLSSESVAAFRFSSVEDSYAAQMGDARDVGVIGAAVFTEAPPPPPPPHVYRPEVSRRDYEGHEDRAAEKSGSAPGPAEAPGAAGSSGRLAAGGSARGAVAPEPKKERSGLGTGFGEAHESRVVEVAFERASSSPAAMLSVRYNDRPGLLALGIDVDGWRSGPRETWLRESAEPFRRDGFSEPPPGWSGR